MTETKRYSVTEYAKMVGLTRQAVVWQCNNNKLPTKYQAEKVGNQWTIRLVENK